MIDQLFGFLRREANACKRGSRLELRGLARHSGQHERHRRDASHHQRHGQGDKQRDNADQGSDQCGVFLF